MDSDELTPDGERLDQLLRSIASALGEAAGCLEHAAAQATSAARILHDRDTEPPAPSGEASEELGGVESWRQDIDIAIDAFLHNNKPEYTYFYLGKLFSRLEGDTYRQPWANYAVYCYRKADALRRQS